jgi:hypothetical protein
VIMIHHHLTRDLTSHSHHPPPLSSTAPAYTVLTRHRKKRENHIRWILDLDKSELTQKQEGEFV